MTNITEQKFLSIYNSFYGEKMVDLNQFTDTLSGEELFEFTKYIISEMNKGCNAQVCFVTCQEFSDCRFHKPKEIKIGEIFSIEDKKYVVGLPTKSNQNINSHGQIVLELHLIS